jgi:hypothetical protein
VRYLHTRPRAVADVVATWQGVLGDAAWVAPREEVVAAGWFGPIGEDHLRRVGDVVVVCRDRYAVLATESERPRWRSSSPTTVDHGAGDDDPALVVRG